MLTLPFFFSFGGVFSISRDFINDEAEVEEDFYSEDSSDSEQSADDFLASDIEEETENDASFHRSFDNRDEVHQFKNETKNPVDESKRSEGEFYGEDDLPEYYRFKSS